MSDESKSELETAIDVWLAAHGGTAENGDPVCPECGSARRRIDRPPRSEASSSGGIQSSLYPIAGSLYDLPPPGYVALVCLDCARVRLLDLETMGLR